MCTRQVMYTLITFVYFFFLLLTKLGHFTCIVFLIYTSTITKSLITLFVSNCIHNSLEDLMSDMNSKGFDNTSCPTCSNLFGSTQKSDVSW